VSNSPTTFFDPFGLDKKGPFDRGLLGCTSKTANVFSIAGVIAPNAEEHPILYAFLGNTFSGITDTGSHISSLVTASNIRTAIDNARRVANDFVFGGVSQGIPMGNRWWANTWLFKGVAGLATDVADAAEEAATSETFVSLARTGVDVGQDEAVGRLGYGKLAFDAVVFSGSYLYCVTRKP